MFSISTAYVTLILGVLLPIAVGYVTKANASPKVKNLANIVLSAVGALVMNALNDQGVAVISFDMLSAWAMQTIISIASYQGVYKRLDLNAKTAPTLGIG